MRSEKSPIFRISLAAGITLLCCSALYAIDTREDAPNFRARALDGTEFSNESVKGKIVLVQFWTTWCPYCRREQPVVLMTDTNLAALYAAKTYPYYVLIDRDGKVAGKQEGAAGEGALRRLLSQAGLKSE